MSNQSHALICPFLICDKNVSPSPIGLWDAYQEYQFLVKEFSSRKYDTHVYKNILNFYYFHCVLIYRYDLFYSAVFAIYDVVHNEKSDDLFIRSLSVDIRTPNELDTFSTYEVWDRSHRPTGKLYKLVQKLTNNKGLSLSVDYSVIDLNNPILGHTMGSKKILHWDVNNNVGFVSYRDEDVIYACKMMIKKVFKVDRESLYDYLYIKDKNYLSLIKKIRFENKEVLQDTIVLYPGTRLGVCDNLKYVLKELTKDSYFKHYRLVWVAHKVELCDEIKDVCEIIPLSEHIKVIEELSKAKVIIHNDDLPIEFVAHQKQVIVNLWHAAINYKKIGLDSYEFKYNKYAKELFELANPKPDIMIAGSQSFIDTGSPAFNYPKDIFIKTGLPRNDILFGNNEKLVKDVKRVLNIDLNKKIVLYAPTWRKGNRADLHDLDIALLTNALSKRFGGEWIFLYRGHTFTTTFWNGVENAIDVSNYPDSQEILLISDFIISDYSSLIYDAAIANKKVFLYVPDLDTYSNNERGFYLDMDKLPFPFSLTNKALIESINSYDERKYYDDVKHHLEETKSFDKGNASHLVLDAIKKVIESK